MTTFVALLRAVNLGGTGKLPMQDLKAMCEKLKFANVQTYIASGNVLFESAKSEQAVKTALEAALQKYAGKPVGVMVRTAAEMQQVLKANPFPKAPGNRAVVLFLDKPPPKDALRTVMGGVDEEVRLGKREIYVQYGAAGIGRSKLKIPAATAGTARNMNTVAKLAELALAYGSK
jgi:uncharacterized protein (DUF1697 family)